MKRSNLGEKVKMWFTKKFHQHIMLRHSCGDCHFCNTKRPSDITLADFWGWENTNPDINKDDKGVSLILVNTEKGRKLWEEVKKDLDYFPAELKNCLQPNLQHPTPIHKKRMQFEEDYIKNGFEYVYNHDYDKPSLPKIITLKIRKLLQKVKKRLR
jgi:coenzyme F420-reducing hydrogenase beta subunit